MSNVIFAEVQPCLAALLDAEAGLYGVALCTLLSLATIHGKAGFRFALPWVFLMVFSGMSLIKGICASIFLWEPRNDPHVVPQLKRVSAAFKPVELTPLFGATCIFIFLSIPGRTSARQRTTYWAVAFFLLLGTIGFEEPTVIQYGNLQGRIATKIAHFAYLIAYLGLVISQILVWPAQKTMKRYHRQLFFGVSLAFPLLLTRLIFNFFVEFGSDLWSPSSGIGYYRRYVGFAVAEYVVIVIYHVVGYHIKPTSLEGRPRSDTELALSAQREDSKQ
ncbi:hypothetical protein M422DRAFT_780377 [Sphaerobolus stellatus SS14]|uniref:DUF7702 domain-containing protein n=1 Tax=Sphaerobolus stellatus (strain SS14) TaxID=990650 RepID=A0A0C9UDT3_SPHS4|nr:hypothetical protein M422DRAFT_780377 [Sphaerobolus stellatus SS14]